MGVMSEQERTEAEKLRSAEIALATIRGQVESAKAISPGANAHAQGWRRAMRAVEAILDARWLPEGAPVILNPDD
jgi:hypothetical protein